MAIDIRNIIIGVLVLVIAGLLYIGHINHREIATKDNLAIAATDTLHHYIDQGKPGAYISTLVGPKASLLPILELKAKSDSVYKQVIDSLKKDKNIQSVTIVNTDTKSSYSHKVDTIYKDINFRDSISTKWYDASINVSKGMSHWNINQRNQLNMSTKLKPNKGLFSGNTLTTYAESENKDEQITGIASISTVVDQPKVRIVPNVSVGLNTDIHGKNLRPGFQAGIGITFK